MSEVAMDAEQKLAVSLGKTLDAAIEVKRHMASLQSDLARYKQAVAVARSNFEDVAKWFDQYEASHAAKGSIDGDVKARRNAERADFCRSAAHHLASLDLKENEG